MGFLRPISLLRLSLLRFLDSKSPGVEPSEIQNLSTEIGRTAEQEFDTCSDISLLLLLLLGIDSRRSDVARLVAAEPSHGAGTGGRGWLAALSPRADYGQFSRFQLGKFQVVILSDMLTMLNLN